MAKHAGGVGELPGDGVGVLVRVAVVLDALVAAHGLERRTVRAPGGQHPLALDEQDVSHVAAVFERRPRVGLRSVPQVRRVVAQDTAHCEAPVDDRRTGLGRGPRSYSNPHSPHRSTASPI